MIPAYTKYEYINRIVVPGAVFTALSIDLIIPEMSMAGKILVSVLGCVPAGYFLDITRDWVGFSLEFINKKCSAVSFIIKKLRYHFKEFFYYLEMHHNVSHKKAGLINFDFFFSLSAAERYYLSVRQAWASFVLNMFIASLFLNIINVVQAVQNSTFQLSNSLIYLFALIFFYYASVYRLASVTKIYNYLLERYYAERKDSYNE